MPISGIISRLAKDALVYGAGRTFTSLLGLLLLPVYTAYLMPADYGIMAMLALLAMVAEPIFALGLGTAVGPAYFQRNDKKRKAQTIWTAFLLSLVSSSILLTAAWVFPAALSWLILQSSTYALLVSITLTGCAFNILQMPFTLRLQFERKVKQFVAITLTGAIVSISLSVVAIVYMGWGVLGMIAAQAVGQGLTLILFVAAGAKGTLFAYDKQVKVELLRLGIPLVPSFAFLFILTQGNRYILQSLEGLDAVGIYSIGFNIGMVMTVAVSAFTQAWFPVFMSYMDKKEEAKEVFGTIFRSYVVVFGGLTLCFFIFAHPLTLLLTNPSFHAAYQVIGFSASAQFFVGLFSLLTPGMYFCKEVKYVSVWQAASALLSLPLNFLFIALWGVSGAALALAASFASLPFFQWLWNRHRKHLYVEVDYKWRSLVMPSLVYLVLAISSLVVVPPDLTSSITLSIVLCAGLIAFAYRQMRRSGALPSLIATTMQVR